jgi:hypothetical protein
MGIWNWLTGHFNYGGDTVCNCSPPHTHINPATGLRMAGGIGGIDMAGNPFGSNRDHWEARYGFHSYSSQSGGFAAWWGQTRP